jgi:hypothetical protein
MYSGLFNSSNAPLLPGLFFTCYDGYMNDQPSFFSNAIPIASSKIVSGKPIYGATSLISNISTGTNDCLVFNSPPQQFSIQWLGYFKPDVTSTTWYFRTTSDDCSYLWIGPNATSGFVRSNANVDNGGSHGDVTVPSSAISLEEGKYYPLRIQFGGGGGPNTMRFEFSTTSSTSGFSADGNGKYFHT